MGLVLLFQLWGKKKKCSFSGKKNQKPSFDARGAATRASSDKSFLVLFFKKELFLP
jgi:hypothetical protein